MASEARLGLLLQELPLEDPGTCEANPFGLTDCDFGVDSPPPEGDLEDLMREMKEAPPWTDTLSLEMDLPFDSSCGVGYGGGSSGQAAPFLLPAFKAPGEPAGAAGLWQELAQTQPAGDLFADLLLLPAPCTAARSECMGETAAPLDAAMLEDGASNCDASMPPAAAPPPAAVTPPAPPSSPQPYSGAPGCECSGCGSGPGPPAEATHPGPSGEQCQQLLQQLLGPARGDVPGGRMPLPPQHALGAIQQQQPPPPQQQQQQQPPFGFPFFPPPGFPPYYPPGPFGHRLPPSYGMPPPGFGMQPPQQQQHLLQGLGLQGYGLPQGRPPPPQQPVQQMQGRMCPPGLALLPAQQAQQAQQQGWQPPGYLAPPEPYTGPCFPFGGGWLGMPFPGYAPGPYPQQDRLPPRLARGPPPPSAGSSVTHPESPTWAAEAAREGLPSCERSRTHEQQQQQFSATPHSTAARPATGNVAPCGPPRPKWEPLLLPTGMVKSELGSDVSDAEIEGARALHLGSITNSGELHQVVPDAPLLQPIHRRMTLSMFQQQPLLGHVAPHLGPSASQAAHTAMVRQASLMRYREKKARRSYGKTIRYQMRKVNADRRPRVKGRFVKACKEGDELAQAAIQLQQEETEMVVDASAKE